MTSSDENNGDANPSEPAGVPSQPDTRHPIAQRPLRSDTAPHQPLKRAATSPMPSLSTTTSPVHSRTTSPVRPPVHPTVSHSPRLSRSRTNSQDLSPHRTPHTTSVPTIPSAAAVQRALSANGTPSLQSTVPQDPASDTPRPQKAARTTNGTTPLPGVTPLRLKSPPPSLSAQRASTRSPRRPDYPPTTPSIVVNQATPNSALSFDGQEEEENMLRAGMRTPGRGGSGNSTLETVDESSDTADPSVGLTGPVAGAKKNNGDWPATIVESPTQETISTPLRAPTENENESNGAKGNGAPAPTSETQKQASAPAKPPAIHSRKSLTQLNLSKNNKTASDAVQSMTVETETVSSIPQVAAVGGGSSDWAAGRQDHAGSVRLKPSSETIRPKKEKKKVPRKAPSVTSGTGEPSRRFHHHHVHSRSGFSRDQSPDSMTSPDFLFGGVQKPCQSINAQQNDSNARLAFRTRLRSVPSFQLSHRANPNAVLTNYRGRSASSKADIFEAKVASAVDEANSSDSEETFVYESNPPEPPSNRPSRFHSRTPSATSMASQVDHYGARSGHLSIAGKKSMKFSSSHFNGIQSDSTDNVNSSGTAGTAGTGRAERGGVNSHHHHHIGRFGRGAGHTSLFATDSPFSHDSKLLRTGGSNGNHPSPRPSSIRSPYATRQPGSSKSAPAMSYDLEGEGADDERTPLMGSTRSARNRNSRRPNVRQDPYDEQVTQGIFRSYTCWLGVGIMIGLLIAVAVGGIVWCSKPLYEVCVREIENVLASEQEIMLDLHVHAINPNIITIQVSDLDINLFAKSKYVGTSALWRDRQNVEERDSVGNFTNRNAGDQQYRTLDGVDEGTDPIDDPESDSQTLLLGQVLEFDSPLIFEPSPLRHQSLSSVGEIRLAKPGNQTEEGGTDRWGKVIQHPFELLIKGVIHYTLPISSRVRSVSIAGRVTVRPSSSDDLVARSDHATQRDVRASRGSGGPQRRIRTVLRT